MIGFKSVILMCLIMLTSCMVERTDNPPATDKGFTAHPIPRNMPHTDVEPKKIKIQSIEEAEAISSFPETLKLLHKFMDEDQVLNEQQKLDILTTGDIKIASLDEINLIILDRDKNKLWQYNLKTNESNEIASQGRGPGDLIFSKDIAVFDNKLLVSMQGYKISIFNCSAGVCEYEKTLKNEINNYSVTAGEEVFYVLGIPPFGRDQDPDPTNSDQYSIHKFNYTGKLQTSFSPVYRHRAPLVRDRLTAKGDVNYFLNYNTIAATYSFYSNIYLYNSNGELKGKLKVPDFQQPYYAYKNIDGNESGRVLYNDNSSIIHSTKIKDKWLLLTVREQRDVEFISIKKGFKGDEWYAYYAFNINTSSFYKIGRDKKSHKPSTGKFIYPTNGGLLVNNDSTLSWLNI